MGLDLHYYWSLNPKQWAKHIKAFENREQKRLREQDLFNFMLGKYVAYAFNDPKHYPSKPFTDKDTDLKTMTDEEMERQARRNNIKMGGVIE